MRALDEEVQEARRIILEYMRTKFGYTLEEMRQDKDRVTAQRIEQRTGLDPEIIQQALDSLVAEGVICEKEWFPVGKKVYYHPPCE